MHIFKLLDMAIDTDFKHDLTSMGDEYNGLMASTFFSTTLLGNWDEDGPFPVLCPLLGLPDLLT